MRPDLAICRSLVKYEEESFTAGEPPKLVAAFTSHNRENVLIKKSKLYLDIGIHYYIIIDPDIPYLGKINHAPTVLVRKLENGVYTFTEYE